MTAPSQSASATPTDADRRHDPFIAYLTLACLALFVLVIVVTR